MFSNDKSIKIFTDSLYELFVEQKLTLVKSLEIISFEKKSAVQKTSEKCKNDLLQGCSFSNSLQTCTYLDFDNIYILFIRFSEKTGNLQQTLEFLKRRCARKEQSASKLVEASMYPAFIILLTVLLCVFLSLYTNEVCMELGSQNKLFFAVLILFVVCTLVFSIIRQNLKENKVYEAFLAISFLIKSGVNVASAVEAGILISGPGSKYGKLFQIAKERLEFGMDVFTAFDSFKLNENFKNIFHFANTAGNKSDVFEKIAGRMEIDDEKRRKRCLTLIEPLFIGITGIFVMIVLVSYLLPLMTDTSWLK